MIADFGRGEGDCHQSFVYSAHYLMMLYMCTNVSESVSKSFIITVRFGLPYQSIQRAIIPLKTMAYDSYFLLID